MKKDGYFSVWSTEASIILSAVSLSLSPLTISPFPFAGNLSALSLSRSRRDLYVATVYRNRSLTRNPTELSFFGVEAAAEQDYAWNYAYLVSQNLDLALEIGVDDEFLETIAESIESLDLAVWKVDYEAALEPDSEVMKRLEEQDKLAIDLELRAEPAMVVSGPGGTEVLQDTPGLAEIEAAIGEVR